jgi:hypothetical protein
MPHFTIKLPCVAADSQHVTGPQYHSEQEVCRMRCISLAARQTVCVANTQAFTTTPQARKCLEALSESAKTGNGNLLELSVNVCMARMNFVGAGPDALVSMRILFHCPLPPRRLRSGGCVGTYVLAISNPKRGRLRGRGARLARFRLRWRRFGAATRPVTVWSTGRMHPSMGRPIP